MPLLLVLGIVLAPFCKASEVGGVYAGGSTRVSFRGEYSSIPVTVVFKLTNYGKNIPTQHSTLSSITTNGFTLQSADEVPSNEVYNYLAVNRGTSFLFDNEISVCADYADIDSTLQSVVFDNPFPEPPIILVSLIDGLMSSVPVYLSNISTKSFTVKSHAPASISWIAVENLRTQHIHNSFRSIGTAESILTWELYNTMYVLCSVSSYKGSDVSSVLLSDVDFMQNRASVKMSSSSETVSMMFSTDFVNPKKSAGNLGECSSVLIRRGEFTLALGAVYDRPVVITQLIPGNSSPIHIISLQSDSFTISVEEEAEQVLQYCVFEQGVYQIDSSQSIEIGLISLSDDAPVFDMKWVNHSEIPFVKLQMLHGATTSKVLRTADGLHVEGMGSMFYFSVSGSSAYSQVLQGTGAYSIDGAGFIFLESEERLLWNMVEKRVTTFVNSSVSSFVFQNPNLWENDQFRDNQTESSNISNSGNSQDGSQPRRLTPTVASIALAIMAAVGLYACKATIDRARYQKRLQRELEDIETTRA